MKCKRMDILMLHTNTRTDMLQAMNVYKIKLFHVISIYVICIYVLLVHNFITRNGLKNLFIMIFVKYINFEKYKRFLQYFWTICIFI